MYSIFACWAVPGLRWAGRLSLVLRRACRRAEPSGCGAGAQATQASVAVACSLACCTGVQDLSSLTRDGARMPWTAGRIPSRWSTREAL